jgi:hypothetical protein
MVSTFIPVGASAIFNPAVKSKLSLSTYVYAWGVLAVGNFSETGFQPFYPLNQLWNLPRNNGSRGFAKRTAEKLGDSLRVPGGFQLNHGILPRLEPFNPLHKLGVGATQVGNLGLYRPLGFQKLRRAHRNTMLRQDVQARCWDPLVFAER